MTDDDFWALIDAARGRAEASATPEALFAVLSSKDTAQVRDFMRLYTEKLCDLNRWNLWAAGYAITSGMGDDSFHYFRSWIIGKGRLVFETALREPDELGPYVDDFDVDNELLEYVALKVLRTRRDDSDPREDVNRFADDAPVGERIGKENIANIVPKLSRQFMT